ncbi:MAG: hypothetical protein ACLP01_17185 [Solirubrobacteraceae bacterium]
MLTVVIDQSCSGGGVGDAPSPVAVREIPASTLAIYEQVGAQYKLPWEILAGIGTEECDNGLLPDPSCTPQPGATGPGVANFAGASGPMQIGVGGAAGDEYDALRHLLPDPALGPHDPTTAVELAALVLIKDKGAPTGQPVDAYAVYVRAYNGSGPAADAYAARVIADAHAYQGAGTITLAAACDAAFGTPLVPGTRARILADGVAAAPADAPAAVQAMIAAGNRINDFPYSYGGAHGDPAQTMNQTSPNPAAVPGAEENGSPGYDCSSATSYVLWGGGLGQSLLGGGVEDSSELESVGDPGPGKWVTVYANAAHAYIEVAGIYFDTAAGLGNPPNPPPTGPRWSTVGTGRAGFVERHPPGL